MTTATRILAACAAIVVSAIVVATVRHVIRRRQRFRTLNWGFLGKWVGYSALGAAVVGLAGSVQHLMKVDGLYLTMFLYGFSLGIPQMLLLRSRIRSAWRWMIILTLGWSLVWFAFFGSKLLYYFHGTTILMGPLTVISLILLLYLGWRILKSDVMKLRFWPTFLALLTAWVPRLFVMYPPVWRGDLVPFAANLLLSTVGGELIMGGLLVWHMKASEAKQ
ncbi:MAG: hypothetical protein PVF70_01795 [Anaerolineales bacterium]|jgi:hypothetical protein